MEGDSSMCTDRKVKFPPYIREKLEKSGYFNLTKEQRVQANIMCLKALEKVPDPDHKAGRKILKKMRGGDC